MFAPIFFILIIAALGASSIASGSAGPACRGGDERALDRVDAADCSCSGGPGNACDLQENRCGSRMATCVKCHCRCDPQGVLFGPGGSVLRVEETRSRRAYHAAAQREAVYELVVEVDQSAVKSLMMLGFNLAIFKGFAAGSEEPEFNSAWQVIEQKDMGEATTITKTWTSPQKAQLTSQVKVGEILTKISSPISDEFTGGEVATFGVEGWQVVSGGSVVVAPYIGVRYLPQTAIRQTVLYSPVIAANGDVEYAPYFVDRFGITGGSLLRGYPSAELGLRLQRGIKTAEFTGDVTAELMKLDYGAELTRGVCLHSPEGLAAVQISPGLCGDKGREDILAEFSSRAAESLLASSDASSEN